MTFLGLGVEGFCHSDDVFRSPDLIYAENLWRPELKEFQKIFHCDVV